MTLLVALVLAFTVLPEPWGLIVVGAAALLEVGEALLLWRWSQRRRSVVGVEAMVGSTATVVTPLAPRGQVRVGGETWYAVADVPADAGRAVRVVGVDVDGLTLRVEPA